LGLPEFERATDFALQFRGQVDFETGHSCDVGGVTEEERCPPFLVGTPAQGRRILHGIGPILGGD
jgi:hypothetical protein